MYGQRRGRRRTSGLRLRPIDSIKNVNPAITATVAANNSTIGIAVATDTGINAGVADVERGSHIFKIWCEFWISASAESAVGISTVVDAFIWKNPGNNLTFPNPGTIGTSNEKKYIFRVFKGLTGARTQGYPGYSFRGWIKVPKHYQRMGTDDRIEFIVRATGADTVTCSNFIYKWYR